MSKSSPIDLPGTTISRSEFANLKHGDLVLWARGKSVMFRTVQAGPLDDPRAKEMDGKMGCWLHVTFSKRRKTRYPSGCTGYGYTDVCRTISVTGLRYTEMLLNPEEIESMFKSGINITQTMKHDLQKYKCRKSETLQRDPHWKKRVFRTFQTLKKIGL